MIHINHENLLDLKYLASGVFDPLDGFMNYEEFKSVVYDMKLLTMGGGYLDFTYNFRS